MDVVRLHDREEIAEYLEKDPFLNIYGLGDLDDPLWDRTAWYGFKSGRGLAALFFIYNSPDIPALLALTRETKTMASLLKEALPLLPERFQAHLSPGLKEVFGSGWTLESEFPHYRMALIDAEAPGRIDTGGVIQLEARHLQQLGALYEKSYPGNWFEPEIFRQNLYFGIFEGRRLVSAAGTHVLSARYKAAALGNIATLPEHRNRGYAAAVTAALAGELLRRDIRIGLNVRTDNLSARASYKKNGFETVAEFSEHIISRA